MGFFPWPQGRDPRQSLYFLAAASRSRPLLPALGGLLLCGTVTWRHTPRGRQPALLVPTHGFSTHPDGQGVVPPKSTWNAWFGRLGAWEGRKAGRVLAAAPCCLLSVPKETSVMEQSSARGPGSPLREQPLVPLPQRACGSSAFSALLGRPSQLVSCPACSTFAPSLFRNSNVDLRVGTRKQTWAAQVSGGGSQSPHGVLPPTWPRRRPAMTDPAVPHLHI